MTHGLAGADAAVVLAFEDLQWADPTSIDLIRALAERGGHGAAPTPRDVAAGISPALEPTLASRGHFARPSRPAEALAWSARLLRITRLRKT